MHDIECPLILNVHNKKVNIVNLNQNEKSLNENKTLILNTPKPKYIPSDRLLYYIICIHITYMDSSTSKSTLLIR